MNVSQRKMGVILSYLSQAFQILSGLLYTPIMLRLLGQSEYGLYQLVYSVVSYLNLLSFGFSSSYIRFYSRAKTRDDENEVARLNGMFMAIFLIIAVICITCGILMVHNIRFIFSDGLTEEEYRTAGMLMALMIFNLALTFPGSVFDSITSAQECFFLQKILVVLQNLFNPFLTLPLLIMGYGSVGMVCVTTFLTIVKLAVNIWFCHKKLKVRFSFCGLSIAPLKEMWYFTFFIFLNQIIDQANWGIDKFLLGRFAGTVAVAVYGLGGQINMMYLQFSTSISNVFVPQVNRIVATTNDNGELTRLFTKIGRIQFMVLSLISTGFIFFGKPFMSFWGGERYGQSYYVALWLILPVTVPLVQNLGIEIQRAKNMHKARSIVYCLIAVANVFISIPLIEALGAVGAAIGTGISLIMGNILFMNWYYHVRIGINIWHFWRSIMRLFPSLALPCVVGTFMKICIPVDSIGMLCACIALYTTIFSVSVYFWGMNAEEKKMVGKPLDRIYETLKGGKKHG